MDAQLIERFSPYIFFAKNEKCFPISIDLYLTQCVIRSRTDPSVSILATQTECYNNAANSSLFFNLEGEQWKTVLAGSPNNAVCYVHVLPKEGGYLIVYFYLFCRTDPEACCGCGPGFKKYAHSGDLKFIAVEVMKMAGDSTSDLHLSRVYYGAHGTKCGEWREPHQIALYEEHPVAFSCLNDHSFYPEPGSHWRIFGFVNDRCEAGHFSRPKPIQVFSVSEPGFVPDEMGWCAFTGQISQSGIESPPMQWWFTGDIPEESNSWWKRLFCCPYF